MTRAFFTLRPAGAAVAALFAIAGAAHAAPYPYNPAGLDSGQASQIGRTCRSVVGVGPSDARYFACVGALSASAKNQARGQALHEARAGCEDRGYRPGSSALAVCVVQSADQARFAAPDMAMRRPMEAPGLVKSYAYASRAEVHRREQLSCARMGLDPAGGRFAECVAGLDSALFAADNPSQ